MPYICAFPSDLQFIATHHVFVIGGMCTQCPEHVLGLFLYIFYCYLCSNCDTTVQYTVDSLLLICFTVSWLHLQKV